MTEQWSRDAGFRKEYMNRAIKVSHSKISAVCIAPSKSGCINYKFICPKVVSIRRKSLPCLNSD